MKKAILAIAMACAAVAQVPKSGTGGGGGGGATPDIASQAEAEAGTDNTKMMTPLRTSQAISALSSGGGSAFWVEGYAGGSSIAASTTTYLSPFNTAFSSGTTLRYPAPGAITEANICVYLSTDQPGTGSLVVTLQDDDVDTAAVLTIAASATAASSPYCSTLTAVTIAKASLLRWKFVNNASTGAGAVRAVTSAFITDDGGGGGGGGGTGDVIGPASHSANYIPQWNGTADSKTLVEGKVAPTGAIVGTSDTQELDNKTLDVPIIKPYTVSGLSGVTPAGYMEAWVSDGADATDCDTGGGSSKVKCYYDGSAWVPVAAGSAGTCVTSGGIVGDCSAGSPARLDPTTQRTLTGSGTATITTFNVADGACVNQAITVTGASAGDHVTAMITLPTHVDNVFIMGVQTESGGANVRICNNSGGTVNQSNVPVSAWTWGTL